MGFGGGNMMCSLMPFHGTGLGFMLSSFRWRSWLDYFFMLINAIAWFFSFSL